MINTEIQISIQRSSSWTTNYIWTALNAGIEQILSYWAILTNTNHYIQEIWVNTDFLNIMICICQNGSVARRPSAGEEGGKVALSHLPPFLGFEQKYFYGQLVYNWIVISEFVRVVVSEKGSSVYGTTSKGALYH